jgi:hypothetical protein
MAKKTKEENPKAVEIDADNPLASKINTETLKTVATEVKAKKAAQAAVDAAVIKARGEGSSWVQIAAALGISPQGARQKYLARIPA